MFTALLTAFELISMRIEKATPRDFLAIAALDRVAWQNNQNSEYIPDGEHAWRIWCEHALVFVARESADQVLGAILSFPGTDGSHCIHKVMVDASCRGKGVGSKLFDALLHELDGMKVDSFLTVDPVNENAIRLYRKWGFGNETYVKGYYRENEDRLVMRRITK